MDGWMSSTEHDSFWPTSLNLVHILAHIPKFSTHFVLTKLQ